MVNLDKFSITYRRLQRAQDGRLTFTANGRAFQVTNLPSSNVVVYRLENNRPVRLSKVTVKASGATYTATFAGSTRLIPTWSQRWIRCTPPSLRKCQPQADLETRAQYLIISHPDFMDGLQPLVQARQAQGLTVSVVDVNDSVCPIQLWHIRSAGDQEVHCLCRPEPGDAICPAGGWRYVRLSQLPGHKQHQLHSFPVCHHQYVAKFVPVDPLYADYTGDNVPDLAIGRFPVRTTAELDLMVNKTLPIRTRTMGGRRSLPPTMDRGLSFKSISTDMSGIAGQLVGGEHPSGRYERFSRPDAIAGSHEPGYGLVTFTGHSGPRLDLQRLVQYQERCR